MRSQQFQDSSVNAAQHGEAHRGDDQWTIVPFTPPLTAPMSMPAQPASFGLVYCLRPIFTWQVQFPKQWYDLDWWYYGEGHIRARLTDAFQSGAFKTTFEGKQKCTDEASTTTYEVDFYSMTQTNTFTGKSRSIRPV